MAKRSARRAAPQPAETDAEVVATPWASASAHEAVVLVLACLPVADRVRCAAVCRAWREAATAKDLWTELDFRGGNAPIDTEALAALCRRAGPSLRALHLDDETALLTLSAASVLYALQAAGACAGLQELTLPTPDNRFFEESIELDHFMMLPTQAQALQAACPALCVAACGVVCESRQDAELAAAALPGPLILCFTAGWDGTGEPSEQPPATPAHWVAPSVAGMLCLGYGWTETSDAALSRLADTLRVAPQGALRMLDVQSLQVTDVGMDSLSTALRCETCTLRSLHLCTPFVSDDCCAQLALGLASNASLQHLRICPIQTDLGRATGLAVASALSQNTTLRSLELHACLDDGVMMTLGDAVCANGTLVSLCLDNSDESLGALGAGAMAAALRPGARSRLEHLRIGVRVDARCAVIAALCEAAAEPGGAPMLRSLHVIPINIQGGVHLELPAGARWLVSVCAMLRANTTLTTLKLPELFATDAEVTVLAGALRNNGTLCELVLSFAEDATCKNAGVVALAAALTPPSPAAASLRSLDLEGLRVGMQGSLALCAMLRENTVLQELRAPRRPGIGNNGHEDDAFAAVVPLCAALRVNRTLQMLTVSCVLGKTTDAVALGRALSYNNGLLWLDCGNLELDSGGAAALAMGLRSNTRLRQLSISVKHLGGTQLPVLAGALSRTSTLTTFEVDDCTGIATSAAVSLCRAIRANDHASALVAFKLFSDVGATRQACFAAIAGREPFSTTMLFPV